MDIETLYRIKISDLLGVGTRQSASRPSGNKFDNKRFLKAFPSKLHAKLKIRAFHKPAQLYKITLMLVVMIFLF